MYRGERSKIGQKNYFVRYESNIHLTQINSILNCRACFILYLVTFSMSLVYIF